MICETSSFASVTGEDAFFRVWRAEEPRASLVLCHGLGEHSGRYDHVGQAFAAAGVTVYAHDHQGHGRSGGERGTVSDFRVFLDDLAELHAYAAMETEGVPNFMLGHSMGGLILTAYLLECERKPDFAILSSPAILPVIDPEAPQIDATRLSRDPAVQEAYLTDPLVLRERVTEELYIKLADGLVLIDGRAAEIDVPLLLIHGTDDRLCSHEGAEAYVQATRNADKTVLIYPDGRHELFNDIEREKVLSDVLGWMETRIDR